YCAKRNRRATMQLNLAFEDLPHDDSLWEQLDEATRETMIDRLAQAIAKVAIVSRPNELEHNDE
ncbi:hypothetical protein PQQ96_41980, partial [Paraburkholderia sediminicola]|uniref:hypothetical protein n=1 Tax=Paraburkholderia sediminicola TaxID=458836 RepID=UPI0038B6C721